MEKASILFLCTGNSCRSQMAEGWARHFHGKYWQIESAGVEAHGMNAQAMAVMQEAGIDLSTHSSKTLDDFQSLEFDLVITVCGNAHERCPVFPGKTRVIHHGFDDPPGLTRSLHDEEEILAIYRRVRDEIREYVLAMPAACDLPGH